MTTSPNRPGQSVRSKLDGTLGVTITGVRPNGNITVIFIGSDYDGPFLASDLEVVKIAEVTPRECTADNCVELLSEAEALDSRAREAHTFAGVSRDPKDREFARDLETRAEEIWDHLIEAHEDRLPEPGEY